MKRTHNFSAGPATLPLPVLEKVQHELLDYQGTGMSVMEMSHRGATFTQIIEDTEARLRQLMQIPEDYAVLFLQGGATTQFSMVPLNLLPPGRSADYLDTGAWSTKALKEARRYGPAREIASSRDRDYTYIPAVSPEMVDPEAAYLHLTTNNTIRGTLYPTLPPHGPVPLVADMSSNILSQAYRVEDFALIYAGAQKNLGPAGLTLVILKKDLIGQARAECPQMLNYQTHASKGSLFNTPPTFAIYVTGLVLGWIETEGGVAAIEARNRQKAQLLYDLLDRSSLFQANVAPPFRSLMNVCFHLTDPGLEGRFLQEAAAAGLNGLKGHRSVGGMRASLYNALSPASVEALVAFMEGFEQKA